MVRNKTIGGIKMRGKEELENIAENAMRNMPADLKPSELGFVMSLMLKGHSIALKNRGN